MAAVVSQQLLKITDLQQLLPGGRFKPEGFGVLQFWSACKGQPMLLMALQYLAKHVMRPGKVFVVDELDPVLSVVEKMDQYDISALPVRNRAGFYVGVISRTDIARMSFLEALQHHGEPSRLIVRDFMNHTPPVYVQENQTIAEVVALMHKRHIHRVFVSDAYRHICGVISTTDIIKLLFLER